VVWWWRTWLLGEGVLDFGEPSPLWRADGGVAALLAVACGRGFTIASKVPNPRLSFSFFVVVIWCWLRIPLLYVSSFLGK
jgi:hypothetical protein